MQETSSPDDADVVIVNTCGFLGASRAESLEVVGQLVEQRRPGQFVVAAGCLPALRDYADGLPSGVDRILTTQEWFRIGDTVGELFGLPPSPAVAGCDGLTTTFVPVHAGPSAYVKIADGCDHACAFCTIPTIKGRQASKRPTHILQEVVSLVSRGTREVVLVSQDTIRYGADLGMKDGIADLMASIAEQVPDLPWIRALYIYPNPRVIHLLDTMAQYTSLLAYLDMPLQHSAPAVLRRMRRPSDERLTRRLLDHARTVLPDVALRTTFITGFPGETQADFDHLLRFVETEMFDHVGVFTFSPEPGTPAFAMEDPVPPELAEERRGLIMEAQQAISRRKNRSRIGSIEDVLIEAVGEIEDASGPGEPISVGRTWWNAPEVDGLTFVAGAHQPGTLVKARIVDAAEYDLWAEPVDPVS